MKAFRINYTESYHRDYLVKAKNKEEAIKKLSHAIMEGMVDSPDECDGSSYYPVGEYECTKKDLDVE